MVSPSLAKQVQISLNSSITGIDLEGPLVLSDSLTHPLQLTKGISTTYSHTKVHLLEPFGVGTLRIEAVLEVFDQPDCLVTFLDDAVKLVLSQKTRNLVDINANVV